MVQLCHQIIDLRRTYYKMSISEKIKAINNKIEQTKLNTIKIYKPLGFMLYHQEMLVQKL